MPIYLQFGLERSKKWGKVANHVERKMKKIRLQDYTIYIRAAVEEEEGTVVSRYKDVDVTLYAEQKTFDVIVGRGRKKSILRNIDDAEEFAELSIVDTLEKLVNDDIELKSQPKITPICEWVDY